MKFMKLAIAAAALTAAVGGAQAALVTSVIGATDTGATFLTVSNSSIGSYALSGNAETLSASDSTDTMPAGAVGKFVSVEANQTATVNFGAGTNYLSFLWGTPDAYNALTVTDTTGTYNLTAANFAGLSTTGSAASQEYVQLIDPSAILSVTFKSPQSNSFETANFSVTPVPEPETYALMLAGLGLVGFVARRRRA